MHICDTQRLQLRNNLHISVNERVIISVNERVIFLFREGFIAKFHANKTLTKISEFTVCVCAMSHQQLRSYGDEATA